MSIARWRYGEAWVVGRRLICGRLASQFVVAPSTSDTQLTNQLAHWLAHDTIFGDGDKVVKEPTEPWSIANIDQLIGPLGPPVQNPEYESEFRTADELSVGTYIDEIDRPVPFIHVATLRQELESLPGPR